MKNLIRRFSNKNKWNFCQKGIDRGSRKEYQHRKGAGRKPMEFRKIFEAIVYVIRTGIRWKALPCEYGSSNSVHSYFNKREAAGFFF